MKIDFWFKAVMIKNIILLVIVSSLVAANDISLTSFECEVKVIKKGCYRDLKHGHRTFPSDTLSMYPGGVTWHDWNDGWDEYLHKMTCFCAKKAQEGGYKFFGVQKFYECWTGPLEEEFFKRRSSEKGCWGVRPNYEKCDDSTDTACVGPDFYNYIYEVLPEETNQELPCEHGECNPDDLDDCVGSPCVNGECIDGVNSYQCRCTPGYEGKNCEENIDDCFASPCVNGECIDGVNSYQCRCTPGYEGKNCEENIDDCFASPCVNGECIDGVNSYQCRCTPGYKGKNCEKNIDDCVGSPCVNGECIDGVNSYQCRCKLGYEGKNCEKNINDCVGNKCVHGKCVDEVNSYRCQCDFGYEGDRCNEVIMKPSTCSNANWWLSFDKKGWSYCGGDNLFITGFNRSPPKKNKDPIYLLEEAKCCNAIPLLSKEGAECFSANWWKSLDKKNEWSLCPSGYFLNGLYRNGGGDNLHKIEEGHCCKPKSHPNWYEKCYDEDVGKSFDKQGWSKCSKTGHYITGVHRDSHTDWLHNIDKFRCCQMFPSVSCVTANWILTFDKEGWSTCNGKNTFITGLYRSESSGNAGIYHLEHVRCCTASPNYQGESGVCVDENWWGILDNKKTWAKCRPGYFLHGLKRTSGNNVHNIEEGRCCRPKNHPTKHGHCYDEDIKNAFSSKGWGACTKTGYYVTGIYRHKGNHLQDIHKLRCCKMAA